MTITLLYIVTIPSIIRYYTHRKILKDLHVTKSFRKQKKKFQAKVGNLSDNKQEITNVKQFLI